MFLKYKFSKNVPKPEREWQLLNILLKVAQAQEKVIESGGNISQIFKANADLDAPNEIKVGMAQDF